MTWLKQLLKKLSTQKPFGVCKKCGHYVTKLDNVRAFRHIYFANYKCDNCGVLKDGELNKNAKRNGNHLVKNDENKSL